MDYKVKETVTRENIEKDIKRIYLSQVIAFSISSGFIMLCIIIILCIFPPNDELILMVFLFFMFSIFLCVFGYTIYSVYCYFAGLKNYSLVTDRMMEVTRRPIHLIHGPKSTYFLRFATHGYFATGSYIYNTTYYPWSKNYRMDSRGLESSSCSDDEFYLAVFNKRILCVYNKKMFRLADDFK